MEEQKIFETIKEFSKKLPKFPDGRIDYSKSDTALVITAFVKFKDKILILKRSNKVRVYQNKWNTVAGYLDELKPVREKVLEEIREELGINKNNIFTVHFGQPYEFTDSKVNKTWIIHPFLVEFQKEPEIKLDWEHTEYRWIKPGELKNFDIVPKLEESLKRVLK